MYVDVVINVGTTRIRYVVMNVGTTRLYFKRGEYGPARYATETAAKGVRTRLNRTYGGQNQWIVMTQGEYTEKYDPMVVVYNDITGDGKTPIYIRKSQVGGCCDPSTETYHSI